MENTLNMLFKEAKNNYDIIYKTYKVLEKSYELKISIHTAGQWLLDNMYIIDEEYENIKEAKKGLRGKKITRYKIT